uniref:NADH-ubiquinone oxidoreductase chain 6 n=1 Tax=Paranephrops planifrons TaxID=99774 RepID=A0A0A8WDV6_9EUCA|nr:NADH dehydrogenase subunit 6 [Paranephrops planifrons]CEK40194.1 NADH dehydrogenase subunit 6 [Paranephrops planifrons]
MLYMIFPLIMSLSLLFTALTHPLSMGLILLIQTTLICIASGLFNSSFWFSYILFLIFLGGMLIIFIYIASLASNEAFKINFFFSLFILPPSLISLLLIMLDPFILPSNFFLFSPQMFFNNKINFSLTASSTIYSSSSLLLTSFMIMYLLFTLIVVVKIINISCGPLRPSN